MLRTSKSRKIVISYFLKQSQPLAKERSGDDFGPVLFENYPRDKVTALRLAKASLYASIAYHRRIFGKTFLS